MKNFIFSLSLAACISGCSSIKPLELPQVPFSYDANSSTALNYYRAMGLRGGVDLPKGEAEKLLQERQKSVIEAGLDSSLSGYVISFVFAKSLGLPTSLSNNLATDTAEKQFILGAGTAKNTRAVQYDQTAFYLPYEKAKDKEAARIYAFNYFITTMQSMDMQLEDIDSELEYGLGSEFTHPLCEELDTECRYKISIHEPVVAYAPQAMGGYKAWVWSPASRNTPFIKIYQVATWSDLGSFNISKVKNDELKIQDTFLKPLTNKYPKWSVIYKDATYNEAPKVIIGGETFRFESPQL